MVDHIKLDGRVIDIVDDDMAAVLRSKTDSERLLMADAMWRSAREIIVAQQRSEHPEWTEAMLESETATRLAHRAT